MMLKGVTRSYMLLHSDTWCYTVLHTVLHRTLCLSRSLSIFPPFVLVKKKNTAKGKEAFQGKFIVIVEGFAR